VACGTTIAAGVLRVLADGVAIPGTIPAGSIALGACAGVEGRELLTPAASLALSAGLSLVEASVSASAACERDPEGTSYALAALATLDSLLDGLTGPLPATLAWGSVPVAPCGAP
jgi:hypothetical protein